MIANGDGYLDRYGTFIPMTGDEIVCSKRDSIASKVKLR